MRRRQFLPLAGSALASAALTACGGKLATGDRDSSSTRSSSTEPASALELNPATAASPAATNQDRITLKGPTSGLERSLSGTFTVWYSSVLSGTVTVTPSDGAGGQFWPLSVDAAVGTVAISPSTPTATFFYAPASSGAKTITLTNNGGLANPAGHVYAATAATPGSATPFRLTRGGATIGSYGTLQQCKDSGGWQSGDVVKCTGGTYVVYDVNDPGNTNITNNSGGVTTGVQINTLTIEWETPGVPMVLDYSRSCAVSLRSGGEPRVIVMGSTCNNLTVRGLRFRGSRAPTGSTALSAAVWTQVESISGVYPTCTLTLEYCKFENWGDGIKTQTTNYGLSAYVRYCVFENNSGGASFHHDIYAGNSALLYVFGCTFRRSAGQGFNQDGLGHMVKSRSRATTVLACLLDGYMTSDFDGGVLTAINPANGGVVNILGNTILHYGASASGSQGNPIRIGEDQHTATGDTSNDPSLTTHSILIAQNTIRHAFGRTGDVNYPRAIISIFPTGFETTLLTGSGVQIPVTCTIRNNIVANDTPRIGEFMGQYLNNTRKNIAEISDLGYVAGAAVAGSPAVNDATHEWVADYTTPAARLDTNRGGRSTFIPAWVPSTAWQWTNIPSSTWTDYMRNDGTGIAPAITVVDPGPSLIYTATWDYSAPIYSRKNHEIYMFGGGHAATTINTVTRWNLHKAAPDVSIYSAATSEASRRHRFLNGFFHSDYDNKSYFADGKPYSPHSYRNNQYSDHTDEFISFGLGAMASPGANGDGGGPGWNRLDVAACQRNGSWRAEGYYPNIPVDSTSGARMMSEDGTMIYYWYAPSPGGPSTELRKLNLATRAHSLVGSSTIEWYSRQAENGAGTGLVLGSDNSGGAWLAKFCNLSTGAITPVSVSGDSIPIGMGIFDLSWCADKGFWVTVWIDSASLYNGGTAISAITVATITPTGASTAVAAVKTMTGTGPTRCGTYRGAFYDPAYGCVIVVTDHSSPVKTIKVA